MKGQVLYEKRQTKDGHVAILTMDNKRLGMARPWWRSSGIQTSKNMARANGRVARSNYLLGRYLEQQQCLIILGKPPNFIGILMLTPAYISHMISDSEILRAAFWLVKTTRKTTVKPP